MKSGWLIRGVVQGVGFRDFVVRRATDLGLKGWVRNLSDGRVEVAAHGTQGQLVTLEQYLHTGPRHAHVEAVESVEISDEVERCKSFEVR